MVKGTLVKPLKFFYTFYIGVPSPPLRGGRGGKKV